MKGNSGQTTVEYILVLAVVVSFFVIVQRGLLDSGAMGKLGNITSRGFKQAYEFGHPRALGPDEGGPEKHIRIPEGNNFRMFINPRAN
ncbi:MAG: hypothetical protein IT285_08370 [Bdellovibrionales bacterium]|nr:hypothetical protein [Bdellovibrionales bacterium]